MPATNDKAALRRRVREAFPGQAARDAESALICRHVLDWEGYLSAKIIGGYMPMAHEADVTAILLDALKQGKTLLLPRCGRKPDMVFHRVQSLEELVPGAYGLLEPAPDAPVVEPGCIDLLLTPLEALTPDGWRLGKGGGYYDHLLQAHDLMTLGVALSWQWVEALPRESWDRPLRAAADRSGIRLFE